MDTRANDTDQDTGPHAHIGYELRQAAAHIRTAADFTRVSTRDLATLQVDTYHYLMDVQRAYVSLALAVGATAPQIARSQR